MQGRVIDFAKHSSKREDVDMRSTENDVRSMLRRSHAWDVSLSSLCTIDTEPFPISSTVRWRLIVDPIRRRWEIDISREGCDYDIVLRGGFEGHETPEQAAMHEGQLRLIHQLLSDSFGVPA